MHRIAPLLLLAACTSEASIHDPDPSAPTAALAGPVDLPERAEPAPTPTPGDRDADGLLDAADLCPDQHGVAWFDGCPDADRDSIPEPWDACPAEPVRAHTRPEYTDGCPDDVRVSGDVILHPGIAFVRGQTDLATGAARTLDGVADLMVAWPGLTEVRVEVHVDDQLAPDAALALTADQAVIVIAELALRGVGVERLVADPRGSSEPLADNDTQAGRTRNRRVELIVTGDEGLAPWW